MPKGTHDFLKLGSWNVICDRCGRKYKSDELRETWDGLMVCKDDWEEKHILTMIKPIGEIIAPPWSRPNHGYAADSVPTIITTFHITNETQIIIDASAGSLNLFLPQISAVTSVPEAYGITVQRIDSSSNIVNAQRFAGDNINGFASHEVKPLTITYYVAVTPNTWITRN